MKRFAALTLLAAPLGAALLAPVALSAQAASPLSQVSAHLKAVGTMTANFSQSGRNGQTLQGVLTMKQPGKARFQYGRGIPLLIVADGRRLTMIDYQVKQVSGWPIGNSPLAVLLDPNKDLSRVAKVIPSGDPRVLLVQARDPKRPEFGTITLAFAKVPSGPAGLMLTGWTSIDAQKNRSTVKLSGHRFNVAVADSAFTFVDPRKAKRG
ncbi:MAG TPA: outer membrane lipoprotein carrier protein LolA [Allosphingosinicella sp.]|jgi:outer membrane lipoprotein-sorting protein|uniref:LolA family protein n=1 Tax=Allosphingosinicella sp. TaxID=2823234 RepID=UPI002F2A8AFA